MKSVINTFNLWIPSPLQNIVVKNDHKIFVKRDDLIHSVISGNKYRKLKFILADFLGSNKKSIIAFGGAYSNLLHALSLIVRQMHINATFFIRGDGYDDKNPTLRFIRGNKVEMIFMSRQDFKMIRDRSFLNQLALLNPDAYIIPEGASNKLATYGSSEIYEEIVQQLGYFPDYIVMDMGTGGTFAGVMMQIADKTKLVGIPVVKGVNWNNTLSKIIESEIPDKDFQIIEDYHFGGFAKYNSELIEFINSFKLEYGIELDPLYTGKLVYGFHDLIKKDYFRKGSTIVWIHGGGNQGIQGFNLVNNDILI